METAPTIKQCRHRSWILIIHVDAPQHRYNVCIHTPPKTLHNLLTTAATIPYTHKTLHNINTKLPLTTGNTSQPHHNTYFPLQQNLYTMATHSAIADPLHHLYINLPPAPQQLYLYLSSKVSSSSAEDVSTSVIHTPQTHTPPGKPKDLYPPYNKDTKYASTKFHTTKVHQPTSQQQSTQSPYLPTIHTQDATQTRQIHKTHKLTCQKILAKPSESPRAPSDCTRNPYLPPPLPKHTLLALTLTSAPHIHTHIAPTPTHSPNKPLKT